MLENGFQLYSKESAIKLFENSGFRDVYIKSQADPPIEFNGKMRVFESWVITGRKLE